MDVDKSSIRRDARLRQVNMPVEEQERVGHAVAERVLQMPEVASARVVMLYAAVTGEVPTHRIAEALKARGATLVYPRCLPEGREMTLHAVASTAELAISTRFGILEPPADSPAMAVDEVDLALVPGLAWDRRGHRLGRGAGFYDRLLGHPRWRGFRCGLFFAAQEVPRIPSDPWDAPLDAIVTEAETWRSGGTI
jgi:5-formyltetrahydrofolate cyclo-ligase